MKSKIIGTSLVVLLIGIVLVIGCIGGKTPPKEAPAPTPENYTTPPPESEEPIVALKTCTELNGDVCEVGEECLGEWLDASDTFSCCSTTCNSTLGEELEIETFDLTPENEDLGDLT